MMHATAQVAGNIARRVGSGVLTVKLEKVPTMRARGSARYTVTMAAQAVGGGESVRLTDARGYVRALTLSDVGAWLSKYMSGAPIEVRLIVPDASTLPAHWTAARITAMDDKLAAINPDAMRSEAAAKKNTVKDWADSGRRDAVNEAADNMIECAQLVDWLRNAGAPWPGDGVEDDDGGSSAPPPPPPARWEDVAAPHPEPPG